MNNDIRLSHQRTEWALKGLTDNRKKWTLKLEKDFRTNGLERE